MPAVLQKIGLVLSDGGRIQETWLRGGGCIVVVSSIILAALHSTLLINMVARHATYY